MLDAPYQCVTGSLSGACFAGHDKPTAACDKWCFHSYDEKTHMEVTEVGSSDSNLVSRSF